MLNSIQICTAMWGMLKAEWRSGGWLGLQWSQRSETIRGGSVHKAPLLCPPVAGVEVSPLSSTEPGRQARPSSRSPFKGMACGSLRRQSWVVGSTNTSERDRGRILSSKHFLVNTLKKGGRRTLIRCCLEQMVNSFDSSELFQAETPLSLCFPSALPPQPPPLVPSSWIW